MGLFKKKMEAVAEQAVYKMVTESGNGFYSWNGNLYQSDIVRACIRPKAKAIGKLVAKHIRTTVGADGNKTIAENPVTYIRFLLEEPNEFMTGQVMLEKVTTQLCLNNNAFILILRDAFGLPCALYPIPCTGVEAKYKNTILYLKFYFQNGKTAEYPYTEIIHIRDDFNNNDIFGDAPGKALEQLMRNMTTIDQGLINAIKNSGVIKWILKFTASMRPEDLTENAKNFRDNYLSLESKSLGVAAVDSKADATQIDPKDYVPNAALVDRNTARIYAFFNTNDKIVNSTYTEDEWISYYESQIEPVACQLSGEYTRKLFSRKERGFGNRIVFESSNLTFASMSTKLQLVQYVDRGIMTPNEVRHYLNLAPIDGGDTALLRKDTGQLTQEGGTADEDSQP